MPLQVHTQLTLPLAFPMIDSIKILFLCIGILLLLGSGNAVYSQFVNLQITVEPEISIAVEQELSFGTLLSNTGEMSVGLGDVNMGVFNIRAFKTQMLFLDFRVPEFLEHSNPDITDNIPLNLGLAYNNSGTNNSNRSQILENNHGYIPVSDATEDRSRSGDVWHNIYLYIFGGIRVGDIRNGQYSGEVVLLINYE